MKATVTRSMVLRSSFILVLSGLLTGTAVLSQPMPGDVAQPVLEGLSRRLEALAENAGPAVVQVITSGYGPVESAEAFGGVVAKQRGGGSGVILDPSGFIVTNAHVVAAAERIQVLLASRVEGLSPGRSILSPPAKLREARIVGIDPETDLAVLKVDEEGLPHLALGDSDELRQGQLVFAFGSPLGLENSFTMGVVSSVARQLEPDGPMVYIQTDTAINPGNSGGPLLDAKGRVMGINTLIFSQSGGNEGIGFAAPSNIVRNVYDQIRSHGSVRRGEIGIHAQTITPLLAKGLGLPRDWGAVLADVVPGGPADIAGLEIGDVVLAVDDKVMENGRQLLVNLYQRQIGDVVRLKVLREAQELDIDVAALERPNDPDPRRLARLVTREENLVAKLGILAVSLDRTMRTMMPPLRRSAGVVVAARIADGPLWKQFFRPGDVIYSINKTSTPGLRELRAALDPIAAGDPVVIQLERNGRMLFLSFQWE